VITQSPLGKAAILRLEIAVGDAPLRVATLMQVRWTRKHETTPKNFISGLEILL
jgi:hypothetical protein